MDLQKKRKELTEELQRCHQRSQQLLTQSQQLAERVTFLAGSIAILNEQLGPPVIVDHTRFWTEVLHWNRLARRAEKRATKKMKRAS